MGKRKPAEDGAGSVGPGQAGKSTRKARPKPLHDPSIMPTKPGSPLHDHSEDPHDMVKPSIIGASSPERFVINQSAPVEPWEFRMPSAELSP